MCHSSLICGQILVRTEGFDWEFYSFSYLGVGLPSSIRRPSFMSYILYGWWAFVPSLQKGHWHGWLGERCRRRCSVFEADITVASTIKPFRRSWLAGFGEVRNVQMCTSANSFSEIGTWCRTIGHKAAIVWGITGQKVTKITRVIRIKADRV